MGWGKRRVREREKERERRVERVLDVVFDRGTRRRLEWAWYREDMSKS